MSDAQEQYRQALKNRRAGIVSELGPDAPFTKVKPDYYADSRVLSEDALRVFDQLKADYPPYGLVDEQGNSFRISRESMIRPWSQLARALKVSGHASIEQAILRITSCPYSTVLAKKLGGTAIPLSPLDHNERGIDTLRDKVAPGAELNAPLFASLLKRLPAIQRLHGSYSDPEILARNSVTLLREPLSHPQQWAAPFVYSLGALGELFSSRFLNDDLALRYTKVEYGHGGMERLAWAIPTAEFTLRQEHRVRNRVLGSELSDRDPSDIIYPAGTRLADIAVDEPTIGCPGNLLAFAMWDRTVDAIVGERLWEQAERSRF